MSFKSFIENNGFKILALAKLKSPSYSILLYLFNEMAAGATEVIASVKELAAFLRIPEKHTQEGLDELLTINMIVLTEISGKPLRIKLQEDLNVWKVEWKPENKKITLGDAKNLHPLIPQKAPNGSLGEIKLADTPEAPLIPFPNSAKMKVVGSTADAPEAPKDSTNLLAFREKQELSTARIRTLASEELKKAKQEQKHFTADEELLLQILMKHHNPRKQLYWALKAQLMYPNLGAFLEAARTIGELNET